MHLFSLFFSTHFLPYGLAIFGSADPTQFAESYIAAHLLASTDCLSFPHPYFSFSRDKRTVKESRLTSLG